MPNPDNYFHPPIQHRLKAPTPGGEDPAVIKKILAHPDGNWETRVVGYNDRPVDIPE